MHSNDEWVNGVMILPKDRFLLYTDEDLRTRLQSAGANTIEELRQLPTLFTSELRTQTPARVAYINKVKDQRTHWRIEFAADEALLQIDPNLLEEMLLELDIQKSERSTTHWAVKEVDLLRLLQKRGLWRGFPVDPHKAEFSRRTIIKACELLRWHFTHAQLSQFLQELAMEHTPAAPQIGGLQARLTKLSGYVIEHPKEQTANGTPLTYAVVERAAELDHAKASNSFSLGEEPAYRREFIESLSKDGFTYAEGRFFAENAPHHANRIAITASSAPENPQPGREAIVTTQANLFSGDSTPPQRSSARPKVFVVHGRDGEAKHEVARFLERIGLEAIILHEQPNGGRTLISKFQEVAKDVCFAVVLMTPDDQGALIGESPKPRARQNVVFELGFFMGKMEAGRVCALVKGELERPSDFDGVVYIPLDAHGGWRTQLMRELRHVGIPFNAEMGLY